MTSTDSGRQPRVIDVHIPPDPVAVVLVLHGGASRRGSMMVSPAQLSVLRMIPVAKRVARASSRLAVIRVLNSARGWDTSHTPADDARWALDRVRDRFGEIPTGLVGHSLGGRAAILTAGARTVRAVAALAPWVYESDRPAGTTDVDFLFVHGTRDRIASPQRSAAVAEAIAATGARVTYVRVEGGKHAMLRHGAVFERFAAQFMASTLAGTSPAPELADALTRSTTTVRTKSHS